jgi:RNA 2',3'-cyclic 3'-phosphodiesterase
MRTFIAIELPQGIKDHLNKIQEQLKLTGADVKWVEPKNIHLTLKFLGEINEQTLEKLSQILDACVKGKTPFQVSIASFGAFPKLNYPRIIWAGIDKGDKEIAEIVKVLEEKVQKIGIPKEKRAFSSHITLGRLRSSRDKDNLAEQLKKLTENSDLPRLEFSLSKITLFKSTLTASGPIYEALKETNLQAI